MLPIQNMEEPIESAGGFWRGITGRSVLAACLRAIVLMGGIWRRICLTRVMALRSGLLRYPGAGMAAG